MNKAIKTSLIIILIIATVSTLSYCNAPYDTEQAVFSRSQKSVTGRGFILRKETIVKNDVSGVFQPIVKNGERVSKGSAVGTVISGNLDKELAARLEEINSRIDEINKSDIIADLYASDDARIYSAMKTLATQVRESVDAEDYNSALSSKNQLNAIVEKKYAGENGSARDKLLVSLEDERYKLETQIGGIRSEVPAPAAGIFSTELDGMESLLGENFIKNINTGQINGFSEKLREYKNEKENVAKITDTYKWYLAANIPKDEAEFTVGDVVSISIDEQPYIDVTVEAVNDDLSGEVALVLKSTKNVTGITEKRMVEFEICTESYSGIVVPSAAIRVLDGVTGVFVLSKNKQVSFRCVEVTAQLDDKYIINPDYVPESGSKYKPVKIYDDILVNPEAIRGWKNEFSKK